MRSTRRIYVGYVAAQSLLVMVLMAVTQIDCRRPVPAPITPDASDAALPVQPVSNPEPGPVAPGDQKRCAAACAHVDDVCGGALNACTRACVRSGGADPDLIPCLNGAQSCADLRACDPLGRAGTPGGPARPNGR